MITITGSKFVNGACLALNGSDEYATKVDPSFKANTSGFWHLRFRLNAVFTVDGVQVMVGYGASAAGNDSTFYFGIRRYSVTGTGTFFSFLHRPTNGGTNCGYSATTTALAAGVWYDLILQSDGSTYSCWINNVSQTMTKWFTSGSNNNGDWYGDVSGVSHTMSIGSHWNNGPLAYFAGRLDEIGYIASRVSTSTERTALYGGGTAVALTDVIPASDIKLYLRCGDSRDNATTMYDESGNGNDFTLVNMDASNYITP